MAKTPVCASAYVKVFLTTSGIAEHKLLAGTPLRRADLDRLEYISVEDHITILNNLNTHSSDPAWAVRVGDDFNVTSHGPLGFAALSAPTLGAALKVMTDFHGIRTDSFAGEINPGENYCEFRCWDLSDTEPYGQWITESIIRILQRLTETVMGQKCGDQMEIFFRYPRPDYAEQMEAVLEGPCHYEQPFNGFRIPLSWWDYPSPLHDEHSYHNNLAICRDLLRRRLGQEQTSEKVLHILSAYFERAITAPPEDIPPTLEEAAEQLNLTSRTLIRRLQKEGSSYKQLMEKLRREAAEKLLLQTNLTIAEISFRLGYREAANFGRAFRKWYETSPAEWRKNHLNRA